MPSLAPTAPEYIDQLDSPNLNVDATTVLPQLVDIVENDLAEKPIVDADETALDVWHRLLNAHLDIRSVGVSESGEAYPETTAGDVRRISLLLSRQLGLPRYDFANLVGTRAAWRDAVARVHRLYDHIDWNETYPENERFWLSDSFALAQRLAAVDIRRRTLGHDAQALVRAAGDHGDALTTWSDLRSFLLHRRPIRLDHDNIRYPDTTVGDVVQVAQILDEELRRLSEQVQPVRPPPRWHTEVRRWRVLRAHVEDSAHTRRSDETYAGNALFWRGSQRFAIRLSIYRDLLARSRRS